MAHYQYMQQHYNRVELIGTLTTKPKTGTASVPWARFTLKVAQKNQTQKPTIVQVVAFRDTAESMSLFQRGAGVKVLGKLATDTSKDKYGNRLDHTYVIAHGVYPTRIA